MSEMEKTPGQILFESVYSTLFWSDQDDTIQAIYETDAAAVIAHYEATEVAGLRAQLAQAREELERVRSALIALCDSQLTSVEREDLIAEGLAALTPTTPKEETPSQPGAGSEGGEG